MENWREAIPDVMNYGRLTEEKYQREVEGARFAHEQANAQWDRRMTDATFPPTHRVPASDPASVIQAENRL